jgi:hypothetical protein
MVLVVGAGVWGSHEYVMIQMSALSIFASRAWVVGLTQRRRALQMVSAVWAAATRSVVACWRQPSMARRVERLGTAAWLMSV